MRERAFCRKVESDWELWNSRSNAITVEVKGTKRNLSQRHAKASSWLLTSPHPAQTMRQPASAGTKKHAAGLSLDLRQV